MSVPAHEHIVVDEEAYWALMYLYDEARQMVKEGTASPSLKFLVDQADERIKRSRQWNELDPYHHKPKS